MATPEKNHQGHFGEHDGRRSGENHGRSQGHLGAHREADADREGRRRVSQVGGKRIGSETIPAYVDMHGPRRHAEHRGADDEERQVVPAYDRQETSLEDFEREGAERKKEKPRIEPGGIQMPPGMLPSRACARAAHFTPDAPWTPTGSRPARRPWSQARSSGDGADLTKPARGR